MDTSSLPLGFLSLFKQAIPLLKWVFTSLLIPPKNLNKYGSWALITGSTDRIGKAFAFQLAQEGLNLILVGRNSHKLGSVESDIQAQYPDTKTKVVLLEFSGNVASRVRAIKEVVEGLDVGLLINNGGATYPAARFFHEVDEVVWKNVVRVNLEGTTRVTRAVLPGMVKRRRAAIVNIGSGAACVVPSHPLYAVYAATKALSAHLSNLRLEFNGVFSIFMNFQIPLLVATKMTSIKRSSFFIPSPETYSRASVRGMGYEQISMPYWPHSLQWCLIRAVPDALFDWCLLQYFLRMRNRGLETGG